MLGIFSEKDESVVLVVEMLNFNFHLIDLIILDVPFEGEDDCILLLDPGL